MQRANNLTTRYTMGLVAHSISDAVHCAGGIMFDRAAAGWDVSVYPQEDSCPRAIQILGAHCGELDGLFHRDASFPTVLVVTARVHAANRRVEALVEAALRRDSVKVLFTSVESPRDGALHEAALYTLGNAAHAFKTCAAEAAGLGPAAVSRSEHIRPAAVRSRRPVSI